VIRVIDAVVRIRSTDEQYVDGGAKE